MGFLDGVNEMALSSDNSYKLLSKDKIAFTQIVAHLIGGNILLKNSQSLLIEDCKGKKYLLKCRPSYEPSFDEKDVVVISHDTFQYRDYAYMHRVTEQLEVHTKTVIYKLPEIEIIFRSEDDYEVIDKRRK